MRFPVVGLALFLCLVAGPAVWAKPTDRVIDSLWRDLAKEKTPEGRVGVVKNIHYLYFLEGKIGKTDSTFCVGLGIARDAGTAQLEAELYDAFFGDEEAINQDSAAGYLARYRQIARDSKDVRYSLSVKIAEASWLNSNRYSDSAVHVLSSADPGGVSDKSLLAAYYFRLGICYINTNQKVKAFENLTRAISFAQTLNSNELLGQCFLHLAEFYRLISNSEMAVFYDKKRYRQILDAPVVDSIALILCEADMAGTYLGQDDKENGDKYFHHVNDFATRNRLTNIKTSVFRIYRSFLVRKRLFAELYKLYTTDFPEEYELVRNRDICEFNRISAFMAEGHGAIDSARHFYQLAAQCLADAGASKIFLSNFLKRYGEFLMRQGDIAGARKEFTLSLAYAQSVNYLPFMVDATKYLDSISVAQKDYQQAYAYSRLNKIFKDSLAQSDRNSQLLQLEIKNEENQIVYREDQDKLKIEIRHRIQLAVFVAGIVFLVIIVVVVVRNNRIQQKLNNLLSTEKKRSEDLLLNILPAEVAEELKDKGTAEARYFEPVTVMFTDFKSFTRVSERLTPQQLVNELDVCFRGFDLIMKKYGIEKIKTVGDAYLAVAGLPVADALHAVRMVQAAHEIAAFMKARKDEVGENTFEIRIGLHSGGVVAGIVGMSKFAYDIWGDTVNTAARMEQNCEPGRVNISEATYQLVKNQFVCTFRGKIAAKNKGDLNMYFVD